MSEILHPCDAYWHFGGPAAPDLNLYLPGIGQGQIGAPLMRFVDAGYTYDGVTLLPLPRLTPLGLMPDGERILCAEATVIYERPLGERTIRVRAATLALALYGYKRAVKRPSFVDGNEANLHIDNIRKTYREPIHRGISRRPEGNAYEVNVKPRLWPSAIYVGRAQTLDEALAMRDAAIARWEHRLHYGEFPDGLEMPRLEVVRRILKNENGWQSLPGHKKKEPPA